jgi:hypothetical protein
VLKYWFRQLLSLNNSSLLDLASPLFFATSIKIMSDDDSAPSYEAPAVIINNNGIVPVAAGVQNQDEHDPTSPKHGSKKRDFVDQLSR